MTTFRVVVEKCNAGGFVVSCPALPGCHSQGETEEEALRNIREAIEGCLEVLNERAKGASAAGKVVEVAV